jgi:hypothetical protein
VDGLRGSGEGRRRFSRHWSSGSPVGHRGGGRVLQKYDSTYFKLLGMHDTFTLVGL